MTVVIALLSCISFTSCGDDDKDELKNSNLIGTWQNQAFIYHFDSSGNGYFQYSPANGLYEAVGDTKSYYKWKASSNILSLIYDGSGLLSAGTSSFYYEVDADMLLLISTDSGESSSFTRK